MRQRIRSAVVAVMVGGVLTVAAPGTASACSCQASTQTVRLPADDITTAFTGIATNVAMPAQITRSDEQVTWTFTVDAVHRGEVSRVTEVRTAVSGASCGVDFIVDRRYLVLARVDDGGVITAALCDGTAPVDDVSAADLAQWGPGTPPESAGASAPIAPAATVWSGPVPWVAAVVVAATLASIAVVAVRRRPGD